MEESASSLLPLAYELIRDRVEVISAREDLEHTAVDCGFWKHHAFMNLLNLRGSPVAFDYDIVTNLVVVGDSLYEIEAGHALSKQIEKCLFKTVKLAEQPTPQELIKQLQIVGMKWEYIMTTHKNITITLSKNRASYPIKPMSGLLGGGRPMFAL